MVVDNRVFLNTTKHLRGAQACGPGPVAVVLARGTTSVKDSDLWITDRLCQNYPQFYTRRLRGFAVFFGQALHPGFWTSLLFIDSVVNT